MTTTADSTDAELRALRERAYGPTADIHADAEAMVRLHELERRVREKAAGVSGAAPSPDDAGAGPGAREGADVAEAEAALIEVVPLTRTGQSAGQGAGITWTGVDGPPPVDPGTDAEGSDDPGAAEPRRPWWRRHLRWVWAASVVAAAVAGAAVTQTAHVVQAVVEGQVAVLREDPDATWPADFWSPRPDGATAYEEFHGLSVLRIAEMGMAANSDCVYVVDSANMANQMIMGGCEVGRYPAYAVMEVSANASDALLERFAEGSTLRFELNDDDTIRVFAADPAPIPEPTS